MPSSFCFLLWKNCSSWSFVVMFLHVLCVLANVFTTRFVFSVTVRATFVCFWKDQRSECSVTILLLLVSQPDERLQSSVRV